MTGKVTISEVAPRDGIQSITGDFVPTEVKIALIQALYDAGLRRMEIGSFVSPKAIPQMADTAAVLAFTRTLPGLESTVLVPNRRGFDAAIAGGAERLGFFMSATAGHNKANLNRTREEIAKEYVTKSEVHTDINRVLDRLDRLEKKIDDFMKEQRSALG